MQRPDEQQVHSGQIESVLRDRSLDGAAGWIAADGVDRLMRRAFQMPLGRGSDGGRPIGRGLPDGSVSVVTELVAVIAEFLPEAIELGPCGVTGGTRE